MQRSIGVTRMQKEISVHEVGKLGGGHVAVVGMVAGAGAGAGVVAPDNLGGDGLFAEGGEE